MAAKRVATLTLLMLLPLMTSGCKIFRKDRCFGGNCGAGLCGEAVCGEAVCGAPVCDAPACGDCVARPCYGGMKWKGNCGPCQGPKWCLCTDSSGNCCNKGPGCGCEPACGCEPQCGCEPECACEPGCATEPGCGCEGPCSCGSVCGAARKGHLIYSLKYSVRAILKSVLGCNGCDGELYWSGWHNDPPRCCDPCDKCGNWVGPPTSAGYRAPYRHPFSVAEGGVVENTDGAAFH